MRRRDLAWSGALTVMAATAILVILDISVASVQRYWSKHSFTSSVLAGVLVLLLTVLIVDQVARVRRIRNQSRAIAIQAAIIVSQARRTADAIVESSPSAENREAAFDELRTYTQMLFTSAPVLIEAAAPRAFLETSQRAAAQLAGALREAGAVSVDHTKERLDAAIDQVKQAAAPLIATLDRNQLAAAFGANEVDPSVG